MGFYFLSCLYFAELLFLTLSVIYLPFNSLLMSEWAFFSPEQVIKFKPVAMYLISGFLSSIPLLLSFDKIQSYVLLVYGRNLSKYNDLLTFISKSFAFAFLLCALILAITAEFFSTDVWVDTKLYFGLFVSLLAPIFIFFYATKLGLTNDFYRYLDSSIVTKSRKLVLFSLLFSFVCGVAVKVNSLFGLVLFAVSTYGLYYWIKLVIAESGKKVSSSMIMGFLFLAPVYALFFFKKLSDSWLLAFRDTLKAFAYATLSISVALLGVMLVQ